MPSPVGCSLHPACCQMGRAARFTVAFLLRSISLCRRGNRPLPRPTEHEGTSLLPTTAQQPGGGGRSVQLLSVKACNYRSL